MLVAFFLRWVSNIDRERKKEKEKEEKEIKKP